MSVFNRCAWWCCHPVLYLRWIIAVSQILYHPCVVLALSCLRVRVWYHVGASSLFQMSEAGGKVADEQRLSNRCPRESAMLHRMDQWCPVAAVAHPNSSSRHSQGCDQRARDRLSPLDQGGPWCPPTEAWCHLNMWVLELSCLQLWLPVSGLKNWCLAALYKVWFHWKVVKCKHLCCQLCKIGIKYLQEKISNCCKRLFVIICEIYYDCFCGKLFGSMWIS